MCKNLMWAYKGLDKKGKFKVSFIMPVKDNPNLYKDKSKWIGGKNLLSVIKIPCGQCIECRLNYSRDWANRGYLESTKYKENQFVTLTYDPEHLPENGSLVKKDLELYNKKLKRYFEYHYNHKGIKKMECGEYGEERGRPHYHQILFNTPIPDKKFKFTNAEGYEIYESEILSKIWGKGLVTIQDVTWNSISYVARYILKKQKGKHAKEYYEEKGIIPEFFQVSKGIGKEYYEKNKEKIYPYDEIYTIKQGKVIREKPPRYFDKLHEKENQKEMMAIKKRREEIAEQAIENQLKNTDLNYKEYLELKEETKTQKIKYLRRAFETGK